VTHYLFEKRFLHKRADPCAMPPNKNISIPGTTDAVPNGCAFFRNRLFLHNTINAFLLQK